MKKKLKIKWGNVLATILIIDVIRTIGMLVFSTTCGLTSFGVMVLMMEVLMISILTEKA